MTTKNTNPKSTVGATKVPLHLISGIAKAYLAVAFHLGWTKYGAWNWRDAGVSASTYRSALDRHMDRFWDGEWFDPVDGTPHLANALACIVILIEGFVLGNITDDRPPSSGKLPAVYEEMEAIQASITKKYVDKHPRHFTIADTKVGVGERTCSPTDTGSSTLGSGVLESRSPGLGSVRHLTSTDTLHI